MQLPDFRIFAVSLTFSALAACSSPPTPPATNAGQPEIEPQRTAVAESTASIAFIRGYYEARDGGLFTACGETSRRHVKSIDAATAAAIAKANEGLDRPRFLMAEGNLSGKDDVEIGRLNLISGDSWNCESRLGEFVLSARGSDVMWSLEATPAAISFIAAPGAAAKSHAYAGLEKISDGLALKAADSEFSAKLQAGACVEAMTDTTFGWSIKVTAEGQTFDGCAWRGLAAP